MERNFNTDDFEQFLKHKTDQYKLYPSDRVWKGIYRSLHTKKWWFTMGGISLMFLSAVLFMNYQYAGTSNKTSGNDITIRRNDGASSLRHLRSSENKSNAVQPVKQMVIASAVVKTPFTAKRKVNGLPAPMNSQVIPDVTHAQAEAEMNANKTKGGNETTEGNDTETGTTGSMIDPVDQSGASTDTEETGSLPVVQQPVETEAGNTTDEFEETDINWLEEMAAMKLARVKKSRFNLQFYFSPTISYRKLSDGSRSANQNNLVSSHQLGVNEFVDHKPSIGVEIGSNILYSPSKNIVLKSGLQFNYSRYTIQAYKYYFEKANIALLTSGRVADTMSSYTSIRNLNGYSPEELQNQYVQISLPIGAELKVLGYKRFQLKVAGTLQPTYLLYNDTYLLSTDFMNYTKEPTLLRKWNVHTSAEAFISYQVGGMRWQLGPQFRYQTLSSYNDRYPIREYLIEYGIKFGVSKTLR